jgi:hypothetical protein
MAFLDSSEILTLEQLDLALLSLLVDYAVYDMFHLALLDVVPSHSELLFLLDLILSLSSIDQIFLESLRLGVHIFEC